MSYVSAMICISLSISRLIKLFNLDFLIIVAILISLYLIRKRKPHDIPSWDSIKINHLSIDQLWISFRHHNLWNGYPNEDDYDAEPL